MSGGARDLRARIMKLDPHTLTSKKGFRLGVWVWGLRFISFRAKGLELGLLRV